MAEKKTAANSPNGENTYTVSEIDPEDCKPINKKKFDMHRHVTANMTVVRGRKQIFVRETKTDQLWRVTETRSLVYEKYPAAGKKDPEPKSKRALFQDSLEKAKKARLYVELLESSGEDTSSSSDDSTDTDDDTTEVTTSSDDANTKTNSGSVEI